MEVQMNYLKSMAVGLGAALLSVTIMGAGVAVRAFWLLRKYPPPEGGAWGIDIDLVSVFKNFPYHWLIVLFCFGIGFLWEFRRSSP